VAGVAEERPKQELTLVAVVGVLVGISLLALAFLLKATLS
jgi:hypothetical protein